MGIDEINDEDEDAEDIRLYAERINGPFRPLHDVLEDLGLASPEDSTAAPE